MVLRLFAASILFAVFACKAFAQARQPLFYFTTSDFKVGVKDKTGKVILPAVYMQTSMESGDTVSGELIFLYSLTKDETGPGYASPVMVFNRQGGFLFKAFYFDNGADYNSEGLFRIVDNRKIGFADRDGNIVIKPRPGFATPFQYGLSFYCADCTFYRDSLNPDVEHNLTLSTGTWSVMDKQGRILTPALAAYKERIDDADLAGFVPPGITRDRLYITDSLLAALPSQFIYTEEEQQMLRRIRDMRQHGSMFGTYAVPDTGTTVRYEIVERPGRSFPFYWIKGFHRIQGVYTDAEEHVLLSADGRDVYRYEPITDTRQMLVPWKVKLRTR